MKKILFMLMAFSFFAMTAAEAQINLRRLGEKAVEKKIRKELEKDGDEDIFDNDNDQSARSNRGEGGNYAKGKGLEAPDFNEHVTNAETALADSNFPQTRREIQQALVAVEVEIGQKILASFPKEVIGLDYNSDNDVLHSNGYNFSGLIIGREYPSNKKYVEAGVASQSVIMGSYGFVVNDQTYSDDNGTAKSVTVQGFSGTLHFDEDTRYQLGVRLGDENFFYLTCRGCADEAEVMKAANTFDLPDYQKRLGN
jgi:Ni/Co efflux regulator RcnB